MPSAGPRTELKSTAIIGFTSITHTRIYSTPRRHASGAVASTLMATRSLIGKYRVIGRFARKKRSCSHFCYWKSRAILLQCSNAELSCLGH